MTNFSRITASPERLANALLSAIDLDLSNQYCKALPKCKENPELVKDGECRACLLTWLAESSEDVRACRVCGCTDERACPGGLLLG